MSEIVSLGGELNCRRYFFELFPDEGIVGSSHQVNHVVSLIRSAGLPILIEGEAKVASHVGTRVADLNKQAV